MRHVRRFGLPALLIVVIAGIWASGLSHVISWSALATHQTDLAAWVATHRIVAPALYVLIYAVAAAVSLPGGAVITVAGGLLFGAPFGGMLAVIGASLGAIALFVAVRHHLADAVAARGGGLIERLRPALDRDGFSYLLAIRLVPAFPFWLVNLAAALSGMRLLPYASATVIGVMPATFIYAWIGAGIGEVLAMGGEPNLAVIFSPRVMGPLAGLALLSLLPVAWRWWKRPDA